MKILIEKTLIDKTLIGGLIQSKIMLAIFGVLTLVLGVEVWKWNQEQHGKFIAQQQKKCQQELDEADEYVKHSKTLYAIYYADVFHQGKLNYQVQRPGIESPFNPGNRYILLYNTPANLIPNNPRYDGDFFEMLSKKSAKYSPEPLMVTAKSLKDKQATVTTFCSPKPFTVSVENLYDTVQSNDFQLPLPPFSGF